MRRGIGDTIRPMSHFPGGRLTLTALSENLTGWAYYAGLPILRTARSSRLLPASTMGDENHERRPEEALPVNL